MYYEKQRDVCYARIAQETIDMDFANKELERWRSALESALKLPTGKG
jgi:hypothetical protein